jgi:hypothetical protein
MVARLRVGERHKCGVGFGPKVRQADLAEAVEPFASGLGVGAPAQSRRLIREDPAPGKGAGSSRCAAGPGGQAAGLVSTVWGGATGAWLVPAGASHR